ncbi:MAG: L-2-amino-thiazoline-4-carboxylic acid hydrolase [Anaerolineales bacterium]
MTKDFLAEHAPWLDDTFSDPHNAALFPEGQPAVIQRELAGRWKSGNRLVLLNDLAERFGEEPLLAVVDAIIADTSRRGWERTAKESGENSLEAFIQKLWGPLPDIGFVFTSEKTGNRTQFHVTRCPLADLAKEAGAEKWGYHLICLTDEPSVTGFNPQITFSRTRTIMQGHPVCDHCYTDTAA